MVYTRLVPDQHSLAVGFHSGLLIQVNPINPDYQLDIAAGAAVTDEDSEHTIVVDTPLTLDITASGLNGLDTGIEAADAWYYIFLVMNRTTGVVGGLLSQNSAAPTMPSGFDVKRLVGAVRNQTGNFRPFRQIGNRVAYQFPISLFIGVPAPAWMPIITTTVVPPSICHVVDTWLYGVTSPGVFPEARILTDWNVANPLGVPVLMSPLVGPSQIPASATVSQMLDDVQQFALISDPTLNGFDLLTVDAVGYRLTM
jgi:hypothetical protein